MENKTDLENQIPFADTILIVDDSELNRAILANIFSSRYNIEEAENGKEGLDMVLDHSQRICALLLDVVMPVMDGMQVLREMKNHDLLKQIPVFLITAESGTQIVKEAYSLGVMDVIIKPVVPYVVERRINSIVELFQHRQRLSQLVDIQRNEIIKQAERILQLNFGMIESLSTAIEFRSGESGEHVRRIHDITKYMLEHTEFGDGLTQEEINQIALAAIMHDVGKISIPDAILNKPGRLTAEEIEIMKTHTIQGAQLLENIPQMRSHEAFIYAYDIARHHHERYDGKGYPDGLKGDEISIWAQIVSISDVYDALVSARVYKKAYSFDKAVEMIKAGACGQFNPRLLESFLYLEKEIRKFY